MAQPTAFLLWADIPPEHEAGFNEWYSREHAPDRVLGVPGFLQARRFEAAAGAPRYAVLYEVAGPEVFRDGAYLAMRRTPDARSQQFIPLFRNVIRFVGRAQAEALAVPGAVEGAWAGFSAFQAPAGDDAGDWRSLAAACVRRPGILRARLFRADPELMTGAVKNMEGTTRERLRGPDRLPDALLMVEGATEEQLSMIEPDVTAAMAARPGWALLDGARMRQLMRVAPNRQET
jgi:hypothetical protein